MLKVLYKKINSVFSGIPDGISEYRKNKILSAKNDGTKRIMTAAACVLKAGFSYLGIEEKDVRYEFGENGKPYALSHPEVFFSLSHSDSLAVAVFSDKEVGIDCEMTERRVSFDLIKRFFPNEVELYKDDPLLLWVTAESLSKLTGEGVFDADKRTPNAQFSGDIARINGVTLEKFIIEDNLVVLSSKGEEEPEIINVTQ